jgi:hypothetical protein
MPYIVTTKQNPKPVLTRNESDTLVEGPRGPEYDVSRRAVATLDEARKVVHDRVTEADVRLPATGMAWRVMSYGEIIQAITEQGGTTGPLPDGTVIEVEPVSYAALCTPETGLNHVPAIRLVNEWDEGEIIAAYNAAQGSS